MTDPEFADATYVEPITPEFVEKVIARERPDALLATLGGQTALNTAVALHEAGRARQVRRGADRREHRRDPPRRGPPAVQGDRGAGRRPRRLRRAADGPGAAVAGVPLDGRGPRDRRPTSACRWSSGRRSPWAASARAWPTPPRTLERLAGAGLAASPVHEVLIEESVLGWKEYELELMRDRHDNVVVVCSIENVDPMGVHTGDSVTVAPAMTLTDREYQRMRDLGIAVLREVGVDTGGCNIQFAVNPADGRLVVIEMNPRVSRSSALASKATGFPIAKIAAKLAIGYTLDEIPNDITLQDAGRVRAGAGLRGGEDPAVRVREVPRRRPGADHDDEVGRRGDVAGPQLHRGAEQGDALDGDQGGRLLDPARTRRAPRWSPPWTRCGPRTTAGSTPSSGRCGWAPRVAEVAAASGGIDPWFVDQIAVAGRPARRDRRARRCSTQPLLRRAKRAGLSDRQIAALRPELAGEDGVRTLRHRLGLRPVYKTVDTCAAEFAAATPYHYSSYDEETEVAPSDRPKVIILGSGPNRIGQGIEFDYSCVHAVMALRGGRLRDRDGQLQPGDRLDRLRHRRPALLRAADVRGRARGVCTPRTRPAGPPAARAWSA